MTMACSDTGGVSMSRAVHLAGEAVRQRFQFDTARPAIRSTSSNMRNYSSVPFGDNDGLSIAYEKEAIKRFGSSDRATAPGRESRAKARPFMFQQAFGASPKAAVGASPKAAEVRQTKFKSHQKLLNEQSRGVTVKERLEQNRSS